jgi:hypothetical protein
MLGRLTTIALTAILLCCPWRAGAQQFDPRRVLSILVSAFQQCGPPEAYQLLSPDLFTLVAQQTGGRGCYGSMAAAGAVTSMEVIDSAMFPAGPLYIVRVTHVAGPVDWFIGFDKFSSKVIYLTFQSVTTGPSPSLAEGADQSANLGVVKPPPRAYDQPDDSELASCKKFPQMCPAFREPPRPSSPESRPGGSDSARAVPEEPIPRTTPWAPLPESAPEPQSPRTNEASPPPPLGSGQRIPAPEPSEIPPPTKEANPLSGGVVDRPATPGNSTTGGPNSHQSDHEPRPDSGAHTPKTSLVPSRPSSSPRTPISDSMQDEIEKQIDNAKQGEIKYNVPAAIATSETETVTVRIYGPSASKDRKKDFDATGSGSLKVVSPMLVTLSEPDNPTTFKIIEDTKEKGLLFLAANGFAEWMWTVTPLERSDKPKKLTIKAYMVFREKMPDGSSPQVEIGSYTATVYIKIEPRMKRIGEWFAENWKDILKYLLPGGAGTAFIVWLLSKVKKEDKTERMKKKRDDEDDDNKDGDDNVEGNS